MNLSPRAAPRYVWWWLVTFPRRWPLRHVRSAATTYPATTRQLEAAMRAAAGNGVQRIPITRHAVAFTPQDHKQDVYDLARRVLWTETSR